MNCVPKLVAVAVVIVFLTSCRDSKKPTPAAAPATTGAPSAPAVVGGVGAVDASGSPVPGALLPADPMRAVVLGRCLICHDDMYFGQQRLSLEQWQKTIAKMRAFGAPVSDEESTGIAAYLARTFPSDLEERAPRLVAESTIED